MPQSTDLTTWTDQELDDELRSLHKSQAELLERVDAAAKEVERRAEAAVTASYFTQMPDYLRVQMLRDLRASSTLHAHIEAPVADAGSEAKG